MADCFSLQNAAKLVEYLREIAGCMLADDEVEFELPKGDITDIDAIAVQEAADAIEVLLAENAKLKEMVDTYDNTLEKVYADLKQAKSERDAAVADLKQAVCVEDIPEPCDYCKYFWKSGNTAVCSIDSDCFKVLRWEWRGAQKENADA